ncbi:PREDICTED: pathogenesis-related protein STH-2-like [Nicotiana attenuata]|uniref:pathogenesis-related protein STH-2-like n=1 Tax=Nicotiana attenuata TaxID=49451 RepID=UPI000904BC8C|nr:PREDICTED: pathogenesis-related protein STH-2-like [Nicotiana attenuata]
MGVTTYTHEASTTVAPTRLFKALVLDADNLIPKLMPQVVKNIETVEGDGGVGSIKKMNFVEGGPIKYLKHKLHVIDDKNLVTKYSLIEGDVLGDKLESITYDVKFETSANGGCICKTSTEYHTKGDYVFKEEEHNEGKDKAMELFKAVENYLLANPTVYA